MPPPSLQTLANAIMAKDPGLPKKKTTGNKIYNLPLTEAFPQRFRDIPKQSGEVGLEIECEGTSLFDTPIQYWKITQDGSLRTVKDHPPVEYVLRKPLPRDDIPKALSYLSSKLKEAGSSVIDSTRTSVHVHLNCQSMTVKQVYMIWCMYAVFEEMLVDFSGSDRKGNLFCLSGKQAEYNVYVLEQAIQQENFNEVFSENLRYMSCNLSSLGKFGSIEFRSMRGTVDISLIQLWVDILLMLQDKALKYDNPREIVQDFLEVSPEGFLVKTFNERPDILQIFRSRSDRSQSMWDGMRMMRDVAYAIRWEKFNPLLEKKKGLLEKEASSPESLWNQLNFTVPFLQDGESLQVSQDCWLLRTNDRFYLFNYNFDSNRLAPVHNNKHINIGPREVYRINAEGRFMYNERSLLETEARPDQGEPLSVFHPLGLDIPVGLDIQDPEPEFEPEQNFDEDHN